jgi:hypothetical protein
MINERLSLLMRLLDDDLDHNLEYQERQRIQLRVWTLSRAEFPQPPRETIKDFKIRMRNMWISVANVCGLHFWARRLLNLNASPPRNNLQDGLALAMGLHSRLGAKSQLGCLSADVLSIVVRHLRTDAETERQGVFEAKYALWKYYINVNMKSLASVLFYFRLYSADSTQYDRVCSAFMADTDKDPMWRMVIED